MHYQTTNIAYPTPLPANAAAAAAARETATGRVSDGPDGNGHAAAATLLRLLGDPTRLRLLYLLAAGERNVTDLCTALGVPQPTASHHLGLLRQGGVLGSRRDGKHIYYRVGHAVAVGAGGTLTLRARGISVAIGGAAVAAPDVDRVTPPLVAFAQQGHTPPGDGQQVMTLAGASA